MQSYCWVSTPGGNSVISSTSFLEGFTQSMRKQRISTKPQTPRRCRSCNIHRQSIKLCTKGHQPLQLSVVTVSDEHYMLTPGEVRQVELDYTLFQQILKEGQTSFACVNAQQYPNNQQNVTIGVMLSILSVQQVVAGEGERQNAKVLVDCRCSGRCQLEVPFSTIESGTLFKALGTSINDWQVYELSDRRRLAELEWKAWEACNRATALMRRLEAPGVRAVAIEQELAVWAPKVYDRDIGAKEWEQTPGVTRNVWCQRAEAFSFGMLRCLNCNEQTMIRARELTSTLARLEIALEMAHKQMAMTKAKISLKNALN